MKKFSWFSPLLFVFPNFLFLFLGFFGPETFPSLLFFFFFPA